MSINVTVDVRNVGEVVRNLGNIEKEMKKKFPERVRKTMIWICQRFLSQTYPLVKNDPKNHTGGSPEAIQQGVQNIVRDVNNAFGTWDEIKIGNVIMAKRQDLLWNMNNPIDWRSPELEKAWQLRDFNTLYKAFERSGWDAGDVVKVDETAKPAVYEKLRDSSGRLKASVHRHSNERIFVKNKNSVDDLIAKKVAHIGKMSGGWIKAIRGIGGTTTGISLHGGSGGSKMVGNGLDIGAYAYNDYGDFNGMMQRNGVAGAIITDEFDKLKTKTEQDIQDAILNASGVPNP